MPRWNLSSGGDSADPLAGHDNQLYFIISATRPIALRSTNSRIACA
jgi:hypothetical protein